MGQWSFRAVFWWCVTWLLRAAILPLGYVGWLLAQQQNWYSLAGCGGVILLVFRMQHVARRLALGWIIDDNGERQKVERWNRGHAIFTPTTRSRRIIEEAQTRDERRKSMLWQFLPALGLCALAFYSWVRSENLQAQPWNWILWIPLGIAALLLIPLFFNIWEELFYLGGWQDMPGAKVLDYPPSRPGLEEVVRQKAHGDGRMASESEAITLLNPRG